MACQQRLMTVSMFVALCLASLTRAGERPNVLFIAVDDLRPELSVYGAPVHTPHVERLAKAGVVFERAYVQQALCHPSRVSLLSGRRPDTTGVVDFQVQMRDRLPQVVTLPEHFKRCGYHTRAFGKVFHPRVIPGYGQVARGMGYSMRTDRYRFTEWLVPSTDFRAYELYDHQTDPGEDVNLAADNERLVARLKRQLHAG